MSLTFDDVTILIWAGRQFMKTIYHRPDVGLPLLPVNEGLQAAKMNFIHSMPYCQPCCPTYLHTSKAQSFPAIVEDDNTKSTSAPQTSPSDIPEPESSSIHIVPNDDEDIVNDDLDHEIIPDSEVAISDEVVVTESVEPEATVADVTLNDQQANDLITALKRPLSDIEQEFLLIHQKLFIE